MKCTDLNYFGWYYELFQFQTLLVICSNWDYVNFAIPIPILLILIYIFLECNFLLKHNHNKYRCPWFTGWKRRSHSHPRCGLFQSPSHPLSSSVPSQGSILSNQVQGIGMGSVWAREGMGRGKEGARKGMGIKLF